MMIDYDSLLAGQAVITLGERFTLFILFYVLASFVG